MKILPTLIIFLAVIVITSVITSESKDYLQKKENAQAFIEFAIPSNVTIYYSDKSKIPTRWIDGNGFVLSPKDFMIAEEQTPFQVNCLYEK